MAENNLNRELFNKIKALSSELGFVACGCAKAGELTQEEYHYIAAEKEGRFGGMDYLKRNTEKRFNPALLVPGAKSVLVFLAPFGSNKIIKQTPEQARQKPCRVAAASLNGTVPLVSEFARGVDYHVVIKARLLKILSLINNETRVNGETNNIESKAAVAERKTDGAGENVGLHSGRVFTDSAPILERAWAVRAGLGFIGKNNFLISPVCGIKNFIGVIITTAVLPYYSSDCRDKENNECGSCAKCIEACGTGALYGSHIFDARKCLSYKTIEEKLECGNKSGFNGDCAGGALCGKKTAWIFGCDDCMNACPWNSKNREGWPEFRVNEKLLEGATAEWWQNLDEQKFERLFGETPLMRAGLKKIQDNVKKACEENM